MVTPFFLYRANQHNLHLLCLEFEGSKKGSLGWPYIHVKVCTWSAYSKTCEIWFGSSRWLNMSVCVQYVYLNFCHFMPIYAIKCHFWPFYAIICHFMPPGMAKNILCRLLTNPVSSPPRFIIFPFPIRSAAVCLQSNLKNPRTKNAEISHLFLV